MTEKMEILNNRLFAVDPSTLFNAFADPEKLKHWWGPHDFTNRIDEFDFREGGSWRITMTASDGTDFDNHSTFKEIVPARRIAFLHHEPMHIYTMEMTFSPESNGTRLHWRMLFEPTEENRALEKFITAANEQNFDRLEQVLDQHAGAL
ncbi:Activator of Hsp90 ATPase 1 family protein [Rhizobium sp. PDO1-076]|uniref:SRPBCC domain-containing protein n=2 Tax=Rhizobium TaxID=379 RepID=UPI00024E381C|nr:SRPBCC domain-containing protein [Rhizobium sp. PDO1-076]EHS48990.1 Activator of Hsp90 ATPase 1 family protein [Rhizobium sp. PDO1-076]